MPKSRLAYGTIFQAASPTFPLYHTSTAPVSPFLAASYRASGAGIGTCMAHYRSPQPQVPLPAETSRPMSPGIVSQPPAQPAGLFPTRFSSFHPQPFGQSRYCSALGLPCTRRSNCESQISPHPLLSPRRAVYSSRASLTPSSVTA